MRGLTSSKSPVTRGISVLALGHESHAHPIVLSVGCIIILESSISQSCVPVAWGASDWGALESSILTRGSDWGALESSILSRGSDISEILRSSVA